jgi:hypothetical protein
MMGVVGLRCVAGSVLTVEECGYIVVAKPMYVAQRQDGGYQITGRYITKLGLDMRILKSA